MRTNNNNNSNWFAMRKNHLLVTYSNFKNQSLVNSLISESIKADLEKESSYGMIKFKKNLKSAEWSNFMQITWSKLIKSKLVIFLPFSVWNVQQDKH